MIEESHIILRQCDAAWQGMAWWYPYPYMDLHLSISPSCISSSTYPLKIFSLLHSPGRKEEGKRKERKGEKKRKGRRLS
jgi:hypothetical protein